MDKVIWVSIYWLILTIISLAWQGMELLFHGKLYPSLEDTIVGVVLAISITLHLKSIITINRS